MFDLSSFARTCRPSGDPTNAAGLGWVVADLSARLRLIAASYRLDRVQPGRSDRCRRHDCSVGAKPGRLCYVSNNPLGSQPHGRRHMINRDFVKARLAEVGLSPPLVAEVPELPASSSALLIYGSQARGDAIESSDVDLLAVVAEPTGPVANGAVNLTCYTPAQLATANGTLFGAHLARDGRILADPNDELCRALRGMEPVDTDRLFARARELTAVFSNLDVDLPQYGVGLLRQARYLLRSCLYAAAIRDGDPCFSVREIAERAGDEELVELLSSRDQPSSAQDVLHEILARLELLLGGLNRSEHESLEAIVVNLWGSSSDVLSMAFLAVCGNDEGGDYAEVERILL